jgi:hypothetical protein
VYRVERFFVALALAGFAGLFAILIWIVLIWLGIASFDAGEISAAYPPGQTERPQHIP